MKKRWFESKAVWGAVLAGFGGIVMAIGNEYGLDLSWLPQTLMAIGGSVFGIGIRDAMPEK